MAARLRERLCGVESAQRMGYAVSSATVLGYVCVQERGVWRVRVLGLSAGGESPEDFAPTVNNLLAYDGELVTCDSTDCSLQTSPRWHS